MCAKSGTDPISVSFYNSHLTIIILFMCGMIRMRFLFKHSPAVTMCVWDNVVFKSDERMEGTTRKKKQQQLIRNERKNSHTEPHKNDVDVIMWESGAEWDSRKRCIIKRRHTFHNGMRKGTNNEQRKKNRN